MRIVFGAAMAAATWLACVSSASAQSVPQIAFDADANFLKLPPGMYLGEMAGVAVNRQGHVFAFTRGNVTGPAYGAAAAQLLEFDSHGKYLREIGHNLYAWSFAHTVKVDPQQNIWATDKGSDMVIKFTPDGRVNMVFGRKQESSDDGTGPWPHPNPPKPPEAGRFRQVTDVAWDSKGNGYISDGYINSRVAKVAPDGTWLSSFGEPGKGPGQLNTPHSIAIDAQDRIYVADRGNRRIQVFDTDGKLLKIITIDVPFDHNIVPAIGDKPPPNNPNNAVQEPGSPWAICITPGPHQVLYAADAYPGRVYKLSLDGQVLGVLGGPGKQPKEFGWIHEMACPSENTLFVAEILNWRVQKLTLHP